MTASCLLRFADRADLAGSTYQGGHTIHDGTVLQNSYDETRNRGDGVGSPELLGLHCEPYQIEPFQPVGVFQVYGEMRKGLPRKE